MEGGDIRTWRTGQPALTSMVELISPRGLRLHSSTAVAVDTVLRGRSPAAQLRYKTPGGRYIAQLEMASPKGPRGSNNNGGDGPGDDQTAQLQGFMRQLRARANWEVTRQAGL